MDETDRVVEFEKYFNLDVFDKIVKLDVRKDAISLALFCILIIFNFVCSGMFTIIFNPITIILTLAILIGRLLYRRSVYLSIKEELQYLDDSGLE